MSSYPAGAMSDGVHGQDVKPDPPTLDELQRTHDWRTEERADGRYIIDVCQQCIHEEAAGSRGRPPDCEVREIPSRLLTTARRHDLVPDAQGTAGDRMVEVLGQ